MTLPKVLGVGELFNRTAKTVEIKSTNMEIFLRIEVKSAPVVKQKLQMVSLHGMIFA